VNRAVASSWTNEHLAVPTFSVSRPAAKFFQPDFEVLQRLSQWHVALAL